jgi:small subunit ribosomal protein S16
MLAIRMQRTGRKGHAMFRMVVQDARRTPTSGKVVAALGSYDPHAKTVAIDKDKAAFYLVHGAQPSDRVARLLKKEGVKLPKWVALEAKKSGTIRHGDKLRRNRPAGAATPVTETTAEAPSESAVAETTTPEAIEPAETETVAAEPKAEETAEPEAEAAVAADDSKAAEE